MQPHEQAEANEHSRGDDNKREHDVTSTTNRMYTIRHLLWRCATRRSRRSARQPWDRFAFPGRAGFGPGDDRFFCGAPA
jgi:hypothetical protein